ncbi:hypothetical protein [uncultured Friedmanniella sp.]|uniref:hypothetical protein n=1 Tax=uncultured Friedmanniella sp. TaxID=335381 RepID=UPI0035CACD4C
MRVRPTTTPQFTQSRLERAGWHRLFVGLVLGVAALGVIAMHQLSLGHMFVAPSSSHDHPTGMSMATATGPSSRMAVEPGVAVEPNKATELVQAAGSRPEKVSAVGSAGDNGCAGCAGDHAMIFASCVLTLTLLVLFWWLVLPRLRLAPPLPRWRPHLGLVGRRRVPAMSLTELSILRT